MYASPTPCSIALILLSPLDIVILFFFFNDTATTEIYTLSLHDALPISELIKIEPPEGNATRRIGPFLDGEPGLERSLFFWNYNRNKKSVVLDLGEGRGREDLLRLLGGADILLDASCGVLNEVLNLDRAALNARFPTLLTPRMTPFGDDGPWADFKGSDLIHLPLGGVMLNCGYAPDPKLRYDTPPIQPQAWQPYH